MRTGFSLVLLSSAPLLCLQIWRETLACAGAGLPTSVQLIAARGCERTLLRAAQLLEGLRDDDAEPPQDAVPLSLSVVHLGAEGAAGGSRPA